MRWVAYVVVFGVGVVAGLEAAKYYADYKVKSGVDSGIDSVTKLLGISSWAAPAKTIANAIVDQGIED